MSDTPSLVPVGLLVSRSTECFKDSDFSADFHKFGVFWESDRIIWVVDGIERFRITNNIPALLMYILLNLAVGGKLPGYPDQTTIFPSYYDIDYVRVWQSADYKTSTQASSRL